MVPQFKAGKTFGLKEHLQRSHLSCQVIAKAELDIVHLTITDTTQNFAVDGYVPKPN
ncbi:ferredoxin, putative [Medicago truncatula]|uniref:Ferredoxin, putative n=1 Tax=Medicago truncatula TaxID=3880 RepID=G7JS57_MEDTR|nr:ferredoxin, putative [Medicago truncatula]